METISQDNEDGEQDRRNRQETATEENAQVRHHNLKPLLLNLVKLKKETATIQIRVSYTQNSNKTRKRRNCSGY